MYNELEDTTAIIFNKAKYARTVRTEPDGSMQVYRLTLDTGELKPYKHWKTVETEELRRSRKFKRKEGIDDSTKPLVWEIIPPPTAGGGDKECKQSKVVRKTKDNDNNMYLQDYLVLKDAIEEIPVLDCLVTGASSLDIGGNKKPISRGLLFSMLRDLNVINVQTVKDYTGYSESYCYKLTKSLRVLSTAFDREIDKLC